MLLIDGRDDGIAGQSPFALQLTAAHQQHGVAVDDRPAVIDENRAIAVAVERDAQVRLLAWPRAPPAGRDVSTRNPG